MSAQPRYVSQLKGQKAVIIGGSSGLGFAVASALIEEGASVVISSSNRSKLDDAVKRLNDPKLQYNADSSRVSAKLCNLQGEGMEESLASLFSSVGGFDHLIHTAGDPLAISPLEQASYHQILKAGEVRFFSAILAAKTAQPHLRKSGSITLTTGSISVSPRPDWAIISGFAGGLISLGRQLAYDLSKYDLRVNVVSPGGVETELWNGMPQDKRQKTFEAMSQRALTGKIAQPHEVAQTYIGLLKDTNITAQTIYTDSGALYGPRP
ncbi:Reductases with broad range of substrate specificities [Ceraceosorus bombacis]|uniref:Reductases with broad range of substrate specificities n=1 Tax=Ceraceosorus bombacis TaxID=401625 RepID=A0A0P1BBH1_9BASI|nr:Reductases with broad range of substrate specificities [Ceraceosorus bombacis]